MSGYDSWKQDAPDPGRLRHPVKHPFVCTVCSWKGKGYQARYEHHRNTGHKVVHELTAVVRATRRTPNHE